MVRRIKRDCWSGVFQLGTMEVKAESEIPVAVTLSAPPPPADRDVGCSTGFIPPRYCEEADESRLLDGLQPVDSGPYAVSERTL